MPLVLRHQVAEQITPPVVALDLERAALRLEPSPDDVHDLESVRTEVDAAR